MIWSLEMLDESHVTVVESWSLHALVDQADVFTLHCDSLNEVVMFRCVHTQLFAAGKIWRRAIIAGALIDGVGCETLPSLGLCSFPPHTNKFFCAVIQHCRDTCGAKVFVRSVSDAFQCCFAVWCLGTI